MQLSHGHFDVRFVDRFDEIYRRMRDDLLARLERRFLPRGAPVVG